MNIYAGWKLTKKSEPHQNVYRKGKYVVSSETVQEYWENTLTHKRAMCPITKGKMHLHTTNKFLSKT